MSRVGRSAPAISSTRTSRTSGWTSKTRLWWVPARKGSEPKPMHRYIINRILLLFPTLLGAATLVFVLMRLVPGDICLVRLGSGGTSFTTQALNQCHADIGIDRPWIVQFLEFLWGLARLDFGISLWSRKPVVQDIATRVPI